MTPKSIQNIRSYIFAAFVDLLRVLDGVWNRKASIMISILACLTQANAITALWLFSPATNFLAPCASQLMFRVLK
jgi:hypothetical protein